MKKTQVNTSNAENQLEKPENQTKTEPQAEANAPKNDEENQKNEENAEKTPKKVASGETALKNASEEAAGNEAAEAEAEATPAETIDWEARLAEAENRGYLRGRNEKIEELMKEPAMFELQTASATEARSRSDWRDGADWQADSQPMILNNPHISIWDR
jgi:hypothetical protein